VNKGLEKEIDKAANEVYKSVKANMFPNMSLVATPERAAEIVLQQVDNNREKGIGVQNALVVEPLDTPRKIALQYLEEKLLELKKNDPNPPEIWKR